MTDASVLVRRHAEARAPLERRAAEAGWQLAATGETRWEEEVARTESAIRTLLSDPEAFEHLSALRGSGEPDLRRQIEIAWLDHAKNQTGPELIERLVALEAKAESTYARFRPEVGGKSLGENEIRALLRDSDDVEERKRAWEASKAIGPVVAPIVREMVELRNRAARDMGHSSFWSLDLRNQEIEEDFLLKTFDRLVELSADVWDGLRAELFGRIAERFSIRPGDVRPWHLADPFFQEAPAPGGLDPGLFYEGKDLVRLTRGFFDGLGLPVEDVIDRSDLYPRDGKNQHAFCSHVDRMTDDVRVLCNVVSDDYWMDTMLHEFGHAVYDLGLGADLPWLLRQPAHTLSTEAVALLFGRLATDPDWMIRVLGADAEAVEEIRPRLREHQRLKQLLFPRWVLVMVHFERGMYADPGQDLNRLWWDLVEEYQGVPRPEGRDGADDWACKLHVALAPAYYHNYLLGDLMASQLDASLAAALGKPWWAAGPKVGAWLSERLFRDGARRPWNEALEAATGRELDPAFYVDQYVTAS